MDEARCSSIDAGSACWATRIGSACWAARSDLPMLPTGCASRRTCIVVGGVRGSLHRTVPTAVRAQPITAGGAVCCRKAGRQRAARWMGELSERTSRLVAAASSLDPRTALVCLCLGIPIFGARALSGHMRRRHTRTCARTRARARAHPHAPTRARTHSHAHAHIVTYMRAQYMLHVVSART